MFTVYVWNKNCVNTEMITHSVHDEMKIQQLIVFVFEFVCHLFMCWNILCGVSPKPDLFQVIIFLSIITKSCWAWIVIRRSKHVIPIIWYGWCALNNNNDDRLHKRFAGTVRAEVMWLWSFSFWYVVVGLCWNAKAWIDVTQAMFPKNVKYSNRLLGCFIVP